MLRWITAINKHATVVYLPTTLNNKPRSQDGIGTTEFKNTGKQMTI